MLSSHTIDLELTLKSLQDVMDIFNTANSVESKIKEGIKHNATEQELDQYLEQLDKVSNAINFLVVNKTFKSADKALQQLKTLKQAGMAACEQVFSNAIIRESLVIDPAKWTIETIQQVQVVELAKPSGVAEMKKLIKRFAAFNDINYLREYKEKRGKFLLTSLRKLLPEKIVKEDGQKKGSHSYMYMIIFCLVLLRSERKLASELLPQQHFDDGFCESIESTIDQLMSTGNLIVKSKRVMEKGFGIFPLLDIWQFYKSLQKEFQSVLQVENAKYYEEVTDLISKFSGACKKCLEDFGTYINNDNSSISQDGIVHELTSSVCVYLRHLYEYKESFEVLMRETEGGSSVPSTPKGKKPSSAFSEFVLKMLTDLRNNLNDKSKKDKKITVLSTVFLLNNLHYILKTVQSSELWNVVNQQQFASEYEKAILELRDIYKSSWKQAITYIQIENRDKELNKKTIKSKFSGFNNQMEDLFNSQKKYAIPDPELRKTVRDDTKILLVEPYRQFYALYANANFTKNKGKYVRYTPDTLLDMLNQFFQGANVQT